MDELRKGVMPCRFCGMDYLWEGNRHDVLKMAGVRTLAGQSRHDMRVLKVAWTRNVLLPLVPIVRYLNDRPALVALIGIGWLALIAWAFLSGNVYPPR